MWFKAPSVTAPDSPEIMRLSPSQVNRRLPLLKRITVFENHPKCRILIFGILAFSTNFCPFKTDLSGNTV